MQTGGGTTRSGLFIDAMRVIRWARKNNGCRFAVWENVLGAFSSNSGRDFGIVVSEMVGLPEIPTPPQGRKWGKEGCAVGPDGMVEWSTLDAQWFGVAQRRQRVFAISDFGDWANRPPILLEPHSLRGDFAPSREARKGTPGGFEVGPGGGRFTDVAPTLDCRAKNGPIDFELGLGVASWPADVAPTLNAAFGSKLGLEDQHIRGGQGYLWPPLSRCLTTKTRLDADTETLIPTIGGAFVEARSVALRGRDGGATAELGDDLAGTLRASQGGGDKAHVLAPIAFDSRQDPISNPNVFGALGASNPQAQAVCFTAKDHGGDALTDLAPTMRATGHQGSHANGGGQLAIAALRGMAVRRLTPRECERLQGFPDDYTRIPLGSYSQRKVSASRPADRWGRNLDGTWTLYAADGPRYKALGNSKAIPVVRWIGLSIEAAVRFDNNY